MQEKQTVEELGTQLQKLARKAFPDSNDKELDRMLKGRFYQALLPKWQRKLGAPKTTETFDELFTRTRMLERHDQKFNSGRSDSRTQMKNRSFANTRGGDNRSEKLENSSHSHSDKSENPSRRFQQHHSTSTTRKEKGAATSVASQVTMPKTVMSLLDV